MATSMRGGRSRKLKADINVVPYIDVMLVLLVIFMVSTPMANPGVINLPSAEKSTQPPTEYIQITLKPGEAATIAIEGQNGVESNPLRMPDRGALIANLRNLHERSPELPVMISADKEIKYDEVVQVISESKKLGINRVGLATRQ